MIKGGTGLEAKKQKAKSNEQKYIKAKALTIFSMDAKKQTN